MSQTVNDLPADSEGNEVHRTDIQRFREFCHEIEQALIFLGVRKSDPDFFDTVQDVLFSLQDHWKGEDSAEDLRELIQLSVKHRLIDEDRRRKRKRRDVRRTEALSDESVLARFSNDPARVAASIDALHHALNQLPGVEGVVVRVKYFNMVKYGREDMIVTDEELAQILRMSLGNVRNHVSSARQKLRDSLGK